MVDGGLRNLAAKKMAARKMESRYRGLAEVASKLDRQRYEALADHWRDIAELLEKSGVHGNG